MADDQEPSDDTAIWRYMDLAKFTVLVSDKEVHFRKIAELARLDPFEGFGAA